MPESGSGWLRAPEGKPPSQDRDQRHFHRILAISGLFEGGRRRDETDDPACRGNRLSGIARRLRLDRHLTFATILAVIAGCGLYKIRLEAYVASQDHEQGTPLELVD